ncbi:MAG TPA: hypothetical protein VGF24_31640 [Vicinamibacterales bacterium]|jgi:hypothetical protein
MPARPVVLAVLIAGGTTLMASAQAPKLNDVRSRLSTYLDGYGRHLSAVVAEELYRQSVGIRATDAPVVGDTSKWVPTLGSRDRVLRSDYALVRGADNDAWVGYRDTFEVDGKPVRDRADRLQQLLTAGTTADAARIAQESSRFNLANTLITRNINVPTLVLEMLHPRNQSRFSLNKSGEETIGGTRTWRLEFKERERPTFIRNTNGRDRPSRGYIWADPDTGEVRKTRLAWDDLPKGTIEVTYGHVPNIDALVPLTMSERYDEGMTTLLGDASYRNYRQFQTGARLITR